MHVEMRIKGLMLDPVTNMPIIILSDMEGQRILPIWVGFFEANAIALQMENVATPRPMTHDLLKNVISGLNATVKKILVNNLWDNTFYALIYVEMNGETMAIDSRPSDAIALALRMKSPIFVEEEVIQKAKSIEGTRDLSDSESLQKWLENLR
ncbi:bifunctional nuclease family protein, partial [bacterium]|nr:bifunctional nuclease family protein [bacterium]